MIPIATLFLAVLQAITPLPSIDVKAPKDVAAVEAVSDALGALSEKVMACVSAGKPAETCRCSYPRELGVLRKTSELLLRTHPEWKDQLLAYRYENKEGRNISGTLVMPNLRRQLDALKCE